MIDTATNTVTSAVRVGVLPLAVAITPEGTHAYVTNQGVGGRGSVSVIDTATNTVTSTVEFDGRLYPRGVAITPDGARAYVTIRGRGSVAVIDTATNTVTSTVGVGISPYRVAINTDGTRAYVTNENSKSVSVIAIDGAPTTPGGGCRELCNGSSAFGS
ncbi:beta-propeller fold lactonase family protein [Rhodococcus cerastii]|nr:beta-propeller fold lactonase family protein [Rhodococcus cerastii]